MGTLLTATDTTPIVTDMMVIIDGVIINGDTQILTSSTDRSQQ